MSAEKKRWPRWLRWGLVAILVLLILVVSVLVDRKSWIEPLPGVMTEMTRPFVRESDLGPDSAYKLLLQAVAEPDEACSLFRDPPPIWHTDWTEALPKLAVYPWPTVPPPPGSKVESGDQQETVSTPLTLEDYEDIRRLAEAKDKQEAAPKPWTLEQYEDIRRLAQAFAPKGALLDQALAAPDPQVPTADSFSYLLDYLPDTRRFATWLAISAECRAAEGDLPGAFRNLTRIIRMGNLISRGGCGAEQASCFRIQGMACQSAWRVAVRARVPASLLKEEAAVCLAAADDAEPFVETVRIDALVMKNSIADVYQWGSLSWGPVDSDAFSDKMSCLGNRLAGYLYGSTRRTTTRNLAFCHQHLVAICEEPYSAQVAAQHTAFTDHLWEMVQEANRSHFRVADPVGLILATQVLPLIAVAHQKAAQRDAQLYGMAAFFAIQAYVQEHGTLPEKLEELVPDYLPRVPNDPFDGKAFRYLRSGVPGLPADAWAVYSIGDDFADDGGTAHSVGTCQDDAGPNPDLVWASCPYPLPSP